MTNEVANDIEFYGYPLEQTVEVMCGLPRRSRPLDLFVNRKETYTWGCTSPGTLDLAFGMLRFTMMCDVMISMDELPGEALCEAFAAEKLVPLAADQKFMMSMEEVFEWLRPKR